MRNYLKKKWLIFFPTFFTFFPLNWLPYEQRKPIKKQACIETAFVVAVETNSNRDVKLFCCCDGAVLFPICFHHAPCAASAVIICSPVFKASAPPIKTIYYLSVIQVSSLCLLHVTHLRLGLRSLHKNSAVWTAIVWKQSFKAKRNSCWKGMMAQLYSWIGTICPSASNLMLPSVLLKPLAGVNKLLVSFALPSIRQDNVEVPIVNMGSEVVKIACPQKNLGDVNPVQPGNMVVWEE